MMTRSDFRALVEAYKKIHEARRLQGHDDVDWSAGFPLLASGSSDRTVRECHVERAERIWNPWQMRLLSILQVHFPPSGRNLAHDGDDSKENSVS